MSSVANYSKTVANSQSKIDEVDDLVKTFAMQGDFLLSTK